MSRRWPILLALLAGAAWLAFHAEEDPVARPVRAAVVAAPAAVVAPTPKLREALPPVLELKARSSSSEKKAPASALFTSRSWAPPAPDPGPPSRARVPPGPPPLPFTYLGKKLEDGAWQVFLGRGDATYVVAKGATIDGMYRVDEIAPPALTITYLPKSLRQTLPIGGAE